MDIEQEKRHLAQAERHIASAKTYLARQRLALEKLASNGRPTDVAEEMLAAMEGTLAAFERHRAVILNRLSAAGLNAPRPRGDERPPM